MLEKFFCLRDSFFSDPLIKDSIQVCEQSFAGASFCFPFVIFERKYGFLCDDAVVNKTVFFCNRRSCDIVIVAIDRDFVCKEFVLYLNLHQIFLQKTRQF